MGMPRGHDIKIAWGAEFAVVNAPAHRFCAGQLPGRIVAEVSAVFPIAGCRDGLDLIENLPHHPQFVTGLGSGRKGQKREAKQEASHA